MRIILWFLIAVPVQAQLFFRWDPALRQQAGERQLDLVASQSTYLLDQYDETRTYLPELRYNFQLYQRMGLGVEAFGLHRQEKARLGQTERFLE